MLANHCGLVFACCHHRHHHHHQHGQVETWIDRACKWFIPWEPLPSTPRCVQDVTWSWSCGKPCLLHGVLLTSAMGRRDLSLDGCDIPIAYGRECCLFFKFLLSNMQVVSHSRSPRLWKNINQALMRSPVAYSSIQTFAKSMGANPKRKLRLIEWNPGVPMAAALFQHLGHCF